MRNKRGDIPVTVLVLGIIAVCFFTLITFYLSENNSAKNFNSAGKMALINSEMEKYNAGYTSLITSEVRTDAKGSFLLLALSPYNPAIQIKYYLPR